MRNTKYQEMKESVKKQQGKYHWKRFAIERFELDRTIMFAKSSLLSTTLTLLGLFTVFSQATHVYLDLDKPKCFYEELSQDMILNGQFLAEFGSNAEGYVNDDTLQLFVEITETFDNDQKVLSQKSTNNGQFTFTALESGEHAICITPKKLGKREKNSENIRLHIELNRGPIAAVDVTQKTKINRLKTRIDQMGSKLSNIKAEQRVIMDREARFRDLSEKANNQISWWATVQVLFFCGTCYFQIRYLKNFFVKQKII